MVFFYCNAYSLLDILVSYSDDLIYSWKFINLNFIKDVLLTILREQYFSL